jgi:adenylate kinase
MKHIDIYFLSTHTITKTSFQLLLGDNLMTIEGFKWKLIVILSANVEAIDFSRMRIRR